jgi:hypothetical protein
VTSDKVPWAKVTITPEAVEKMSELADEVERLRANDLIVMARWREDREEVERLTNKTVRMAADWADEVEHLRAALEEVRVLEQKAWVRGSSGGEVALRAIAIARQALEEK